MMEMPFFAAFMIFIILWYDGEGEASLLPRSLYGCLLQLSPCSASGWSLILLEIKRIRYYLKAPYPEKRRKEGKREMRAWNFYREECLLACEDFCCCSCCHHPRTWTITHPPCWIASVTTRALANMAACGFFFFFPLLRHEVAVPRIPTCGPLNLACEKCGAQVRNRNETQVITPSDTTPGGRGL